MGGIVLGQIAVLGYTEYTQFCKIGMVFHMENVYFANFLPVFFAKNQSY
jgi:hypothetical protein